MNIKASLFLAYKTIVRGSKGTLIMTILIMTLAYVNLIFISSIFGGIVEAINEQYIDNLYGNIVITPASDKIYIENKQTSSINHIPGIVAISAHYINDALISYDEYKDGNNIQQGKWKIKSVNVEDEKRVTAISNSIISGEYLDDKDRDKIVIGKEIAGGQGGDLDYLSLGGVLVGDKIDVKFSNNIKRTYTIKGIFSTKNNQADQMAFITRKEMESVLGVHNLSSEIIIKTTEKGQEEQYIEQIRQSGFYDEEIRTWEQLTGFTSSASKSFTMISIILGAIGTVVAGITIFIIIFVSIVNKRRQIGILKAIGMKESTIILSFVMQAVFYAIIGILLGISIILFIIRPFFVDNPLDFPVGWVSLKITFDIIKISNISLMVAALIGGFIPAFRGTRESILDSIWG
jgi:putative ABC transport system permease protein